MTFANPADIELLVLDVDGVLTAGEVILDETGRVSYHFNVQDGSGIKYWYRYGGKAAIVTGRKSEAVLVRAQELGIEIVYQSALRKIESFRRCLSDCGIDPSKVACVGDDLPDLPLLRNCGFPVAVANAVREVKQEAAYVTRRTGGDGAVREVIELLLRAKGYWSDLIAGYQRQTLAESGE
jgi:3-deoxy-D-manno-octulosonate 8-phosphate phosphatase (KDO 8-P phosphatase)